MRHFLRCFSGIILALTSTLVSSDDLLDKYFFSVYLTTSEQTVFHYIKEPETDYVRAVNSKDFFSRNAIRLDINAAKKAVDIIRTDYKEAYIKATNAGRGLEMNVPITDKIFFKVESPYAHTWLKDGSHSQALNEDKMLDLAKILDEVHKIDAMATEMFTSGLPGDANLLERHWNFRREVLKTPSLKVELVLEPESTFIYFWKGPSSDEGFYHSPNYIKIEHANIVSHTIRNDVRRTITEMEKSDQSNHRVLLPTKGGQRFNLYKKGGMSPVEILYHTNRGSVKIARSDLAALADALELANSLNEQANTMFR
tara:strand:+ start:60876 stop:61811 length:936 start_codon:yes stop_codon:yes gene_type:complete|eukprot:TRINITY_DN1968_c0_g1_i2.p1 TRINITY_DN1968_c0_g1~~TRINITY_DN1968_c0_g1_i2.p1  ORF type:complete len:312 (+),score=-32.74 TRINITY_DN1968_c0_g1_i2:601-1536(+)